MPVLPAATSGALLSIKKRSLHFSFWPVYRGARRFGLQSTLFAMDPWSVMRDRIRSDCPVGARAEALALIEQSADFYNSSLSSSIAAARPLQLYYALMNLVKALLLCRTTTTSFERAQHGLGEHLHPNSPELTGAYLSAHPSPNRNGFLQVFAEFHRLLTGANIASGTQYDLPVLLPQILAGHRLWASAADKTERFIGLHDIRVMDDPGSNTIWLNLIVAAEDLTRLGLSHSRFLADSGLGTDFQEVRSNEFRGQSKLLCFEQTAKQHYAHRAADEVQSLVSSLKSSVWVSINGDQPYRRYYAYVSPATERLQVLPQMLSIFAITYYLGSITRYRPQHFDKILSSVFGPRIEEFIMAQPLQFIYMVASEFAQQEVTKPALI